jgi:hypothetical protein
MSMDPRTQAELQMLSSLTSQGSLRRTDETEILAEAHSSDSQSLRTADNVHSPASHGLQSSTTNPCDNLKPPKLFPGAPESASQNPMVHGHTSTLNRSLGRSYSQGTLRAHKQGALLEILASVMEDPSMQNRRFPSRVIHQDYAQHKKVWLHDPIALLLTRTPNQRCDKIFLADFVGRNPKLQT